MNEIKITILAIFRILKQSWIQFRTIFDPLENGNGIEWKGTFRTAMLAFRLFYPCEVLAFYKGCRIKCENCKPFEAWKEHFRNENIDWE